MQHTTKLSLDVVAPTDADAVTASADKLGNSLAEGVVVRSTGSWAHVQVGDTVVRARMRGRFRLRHAVQTNPVAVGDHVTLRRNRDGSGAIIRIHERASSLSRRAAGRRVGEEQVMVANIDVVWIVQSAALPKPNPGLIDRLLVATEAQDTPVKVIINKMDLASQADRDVVKVLRSRYKHLGYPVLLTSAALATGLDAVSEGLAGRRNVFAGPSGAGKTSLINALLPGLQLRTGPVSLRTRKGRHVTAYAELFPMPEGGFIVDTPGIREFGVLDLEPWELSHHFPEFRQLLVHCRFTACTHDHEPGCRIKEAYESSAVEEARYISYLNILHSIKAGAADIGR